MKHFNHIKHDKGVDDLETRLRKKGYTVINREFVYNKGEIDLWATYWDDQGIRYDHLYEYKISPGKKSKAAKQLYRAEEYLNKSGFYNVKKIFVSRKHDGSFYVRRI